MECVFLCDRYEIYDSPTPTPKYRIPATSKASEKLKSWGFLYGTKARQLIYVLADHNRLRLYPNSYYVLAFWHDMKRLRNRNKIFSLSRKHVHKHTHTEYGRRLSEKSGNSGYPSIGETGAAI